MLLPARLGVMVKYGDGPHIMALSMIPIALTCTWHALQSFRPLWIALASIACAAVLSTDLSGATSLVVFYLILIWSLWITHQDKRIVKAALSIIALSYGLTAFWLVPSYFVVIAENLKYFATHGTSWSIWFAVAAAVGYALLSDRFALGEPERAWMVFTTGCAIFFSLNVLANFYFKFRVAGEPTRLVPELDLAYILFAAAVLQSMWNRPGTGLRWLSGVVVLLSFCTTVGYLRHAWEMFPRWPDFIDTGRIQDVRVAVEATCRTRASCRPVRYGSGWMHGMTSRKSAAVPDQAMLSRAVDQSQWELKLGPTPEASTLWLQCLAVDAVYVSDEKSQEAFKETANPHKYDATLPVLFDDRGGNRIFRVPRRYPARARVVDTERLNALRPPRGNGDLENLQAYVDVIEKGVDSQPILTRMGTDAMNIRATLPSGQSIVVQESYDPAWRAWSSGQIDTHPPWTRWDLWRSTYRRECKTSNSLS